MRVTLKRSAMKSRRFLLLLVLVPSTVVGLSVVSAQPASAAGCYSYSCVGHDPQVYGCSWDTWVRNYAHDSSGTTVATITNWYSYNCHTNWGAASLTAAALNAGHTMYVEVTTVDTHGVREFMCYPGPSDTGQTWEGCTNYPYSGYGGPYLAWTDMVEGTNVTQAAVIVQTSGGSFIGSATASQ
jgi:hypothetical protein